MKQLTDSISFPDYDAYLRAEWSKFVNDLTRSRASFELTADITIKQALDVGCGAGQELLPFIREGAFGVGLDISPEVGRVGRELFAAHGYGESVVFMRGAGEALPFASCAFDLVICRLVLPYTDNARTLKEFSRVLRPGGALLLKIHHASYYLHEFRKSLTTTQFLHLIYTARVLLAGATYHLTGKQPRGRFPSSETFQTVWLLKREIERAGLTIQSRMPDGNPLTPSFLIIKPNPR